MSRAARLYQLQQLDDDEEQSHQRLAHIAAEMGESETLREARKSNQEAAHELQRWSARQRDLELEVQGLKDEIAASERKLYGGAIRNPKELEDLQAKTASLKRLREKREEELLEAMIARDEADAALAQAKAWLRQVEAAWAADQEALGSEAAQLKTRLSEISESREALLPPIPAEDIDIYQSLRRTKGKAAVAAMRAGACTACGMEVPSGRLERGRRAGLLFCGNCERILVLESEIKT